MSLWAKIKLAWVGRKIAAQVISIKTRFKEPMFWAALLGNGLSAIATLKGMIPHEYAPYAIAANALLTSGYNYTRGLEKIKTDGVTPYKNSTEFWLGLASMVNNGMIAAQAEGGVDWKVLAVATVLTGHAITAARDLANMEPDEAKKIAAGVPVAPLPGLAETK